MAGQEVSSLYRCWSCTAALEIERSDPKTSVTFLSFACSGATITKGLIGEYDGIEPPKGAQKLPPQTSQILNSICQTWPSKTCRQVDVLMISVGGNDIGFSDIIKKCMAIFGCDVHPQLASLLATQFSSLPSIYANLAADIKQKFKVSNILITEYPDPAHNAAGRYCTGFDLRGSPFALIGPDEWKWAKEKVLTTLNQQVQNAAKSNGWTYVGDIVSQFTTHGYCAGDQRWYRTISDSRTIQGNIDGSMHPNIAGHTVYKNSLIKAMKALFEQQKNQPPDTQITSVC